MSEIEYLVPDWSAPESVRAVFTLRSGGVSTGPYRSLNLGAHVKDEPEAVAENRRRVRTRFDLPAEPTWLRQVHGTDVADLDDLDASAHLADANVAGPSSAADAAMTRRTDRVCVIQVADCMPVLFAARDGSAVAAAHAGWRGLAAGVLEATLDRLALPANDVVAWLGPAIGAASFEVGDEVRAAFDGSPASAFTRNARGRWQCDLHAIASSRLRARGMENIHGDPQCTYADPARFFSFRRDGPCGRMAALIWIDASIVGQSNNKPPHP